MSEILQIEPYSVFWLHARVRAEPSYAATVLHHSFYQESDAQSLPTAVVGQQGTVLGGYALKSILVV